MGKALQITAFLVLILCCSGPYHALATHTEPLDSGGRKQQEDTASVMDRLERFALKDNLISKLVRSVMVIDHDAAPADTTQTSENEYTKHNQRIINKVEIIVLDPFGYNVNEMAMYKINRLERIGNGLHHSTRNWVVENKLLFREGDSVDDFRISESERLLRSSAYILDANIMMKETRENSDSVDVTVIVQDVFSLGAAVSGDPQKPNGDLTVNDINFLGLGQRLEGKIWYDRDYYRNWKFSGYYFVPEIGNTYISARLFYETMNFDRRYGISLNRGFFSAATRWAGGLDLFNIKEAYSAVTNDTILYTGVHNYNYRDLWIGHAFKAQNPVTERQKKSQLIVSGRVVNREYVDRNIYTEDLGRVFQDQLLLLGGVGYSFREYYKDRYIFGFGRTEDIPLGYLINFTAGLDYSTYNIRPYTGAKAAYGWNNSSLGYMYLSLEGGGYVNGGDIEQGVIAAEMQYWTSMLHLGRWMVRQFWWNRYSMGYNRKPGESLHINRDQGLRVFSAPLNGTRKLVSNYEMDLFTPYQPLGFKMVGVLFVDFALLGTKEHSLFKSRLYQGYGIGLRLRNERLIFNTFQVSLHYFPTAADFGAREFRYYHTENPYYRPRGFEFSRPYTATF